ncbi:MAG: cytochrome [Synechococcaceae cyanobacterium SM2_3_1]|nr:cytochrome [Synechococcaceae cyanobacterium SM2_3_1]
MGKTIIGVMGPGESASDHDCQLAYRMGELIAAASWVLLTGGRAVGVMDAASRGAKAAGGLTVGILPDAHPAQASAALDLVILTGLDQGRNVINVLSSQVIVICGMGPGTASEAALAVKWGRPMVWLDPAPLWIDFFQDLSGQPAIVAPNPETAILRIQDLVVGSSGSHEIMI